jgi:hypothetical protein
LFFIFLTLTACIQVDTVVKVKTDGSGTIEETFLMKKDLLQQMQKMMADMAKSMAEMLADGEHIDGNQRNNDGHMKSEPFDFFDEAKLKESARDKGEEVTFLKGSKIVTEGYEGYRAIYAYEDINKVKINQNPGDKAPSVPQRDGSDTEKNKKEYVIFTFKKGTPAELIIKPPRSSRNSKSKSSQDAQTSQNKEKLSDEMAVQATELFQGAKLALSVVVDGNIVETNATYREGSKITLATLDFGKLIGMPELFKKFSESNLNSLEEAEVLVQQIPGIEVDLHEEIRILFE